LTPTVIQIVTFAVGWSCGWWLIVGTHRFTVRPTQRSCRVSVIIPARNEAATICALVASVVGELRAGDDIIVVDDGSTDDTAARARAEGARVVRIDAVPDGWAGKAHACWRGASVTHGEVLVFLDADVTISGGVIDSLCAEVNDHPDALVSVMPWHRTGSLVERASLVFNVVSSFVARSSLTRSSTGRRARRVAFGPVMATTRAAYLAAGGHAAPSVRGAVIEDIALARRYASSRPGIGRRSEVEYRMYPLGWRQLVEGWTKNTVLGGAAAPMSVTVCTVAFVASIAGGWLTSPWFAVASVVQLWWMARRVGNYRVLDAIAHPIHVAIFSAIVARSAWSSVVRGRVSWRGRTIATR
jgi:4,4'-diaponeurosporenoate glycosyltransferase